MKHSLAALFVGSALMFTGIATVEAHGDRREWRHHQHRHHDHWRGRVFVAPPVAYYPRYVTPPVVYAPPQVVYSAPVFYERTYSRPGVTISVPPLFIGF
ncbi:MAG: hypothetical protein E6R11_08260 [Rhodocyclaceae bacterium]|nr:MAG: hypothetical protein E6R11_08260 [Rhodocyclaceae bacterium]